MFVRRILTSFSVLFVLVLLVYPVFAQISDLQITVKLPDEVNLEDEVLVTIELSNKDGDAVLDVMPSVTFSPLDNISEYILFDCDGDDTEECQVNNQGVPGVFEAAFFMESAMVTMTVSAGGVDQLVEISTSGSSVVSTSSDTGTVPALISDASPSSSAPAALADVQVGPHPSIWFLFVPLAMLASGVLVFIVKASK